MSQKRINELKREIELLESQEAGKLLTKIDKQVSALVKGMSYEEMCKVRNVLNEHIRNKYADDLDE